MNLQSQDNTQSGKLFYIILTCKKIYVLHFLNDFVLCSSSIFEFLYYNKNSMKD